MPPWVTARTSESITGRSSIPLAVLQTPATATTSVAIVGVHLIRFPPCVKYPSNFPEPGAFGVERERRLAPQTPSRYSLVVSRRTDRVRLAIVGCGNISQLNAPGYLQHPRCDVVALCDTDPERAKRRGREWGITPRVYSDLAQVLDDASVDAVELLTPTWLHADQIVAALEAGKHVSCQKPLATTIAEADRIAAAVARARTMFRVTENFLYYPPIVKAKELLDAGAIGEPSLVRIHTTRAQHGTGQAIELEPDAMVWRGDRQLSGAGRLASGLRWGGRGFRRRPARRAPAGAGRPGREAHPPGAAGDLRGRTPRTRGGAGVGQVSRPPCSESRLGRRGPAPAPAR